MVCAREGAFVSFELFLRTLLLYIGLGLVNILTLAAVADATPPPGCSSEDDRDATCSGPRRHVGIDGTSLLQRTGEALHEAGRRAGRLHQRRRR